MEGRIEMPINTLAAAAAAAVDLVHMCIRS
jgi:hypothetical protein